MGQSWRTAARWIGLAAALVAAVPATALADSFVVSGQVVPGHLSISVTKPRMIARPAKRRALRIAALPLNVPIRVTDTRGSGGGWGVALTAVAKPLSKRHHGPAPRIAVRGVTVSCLGCRLPVNRVRYPVALRGRRPIRVFGAARRSGMGIMRLLAGLAVTGNTTSYAITVNVAQTAGP